MNVTKFPLLADLAKIDWQPLNSSDTMYMCTLRNIYVVLSLDLKLNKNMEKTIQRNVPSSKTGSHKEELLVKLFIK